MKDKIVLFIIGLLLGAVIATGAFYVYTRSASSCNCNNSSNIEQNGGTPPDMPNGGSGTPPEKPTGDNGSTPPDMPSNTTTQESNE